MSTAVGLFTLRSLRGGLNNSDPAIGIPDDQCTVANNVEFNFSMLGERRKGTSAITLGANIANKDRVTFGIRHLPTTDETAAQLWLLGMADAGPSLQLSYKDTSWHDVTITDTPSTSGFDPYRWNAVSVHGKLFFAYNSAVDRLHVWDGTSFRKVGLAAPSAAPTGANDGGVGTFTGLRYYRVRVVEVSGSLVLRRSEPSDELSFTPNGNDTGITVTKPTLPGEGETHWELEASIDGTNFYRIARTIVATTTATDTQDYNTGYAQSFPLSEDIGDYSLPWSARYLTVDGDRLVFAGSHEDSSLGSTLGWSPVYNADGVGNDERYELDTDPTLGLDGFEGGVCTGLSLASSGSFFFFKFNHIYKLVRTGQRERAYDVVPISKERGALHGSVVNGVDEFGRSCVYFLDPSVGPCRFGAGGLQWCSGDIRLTWEDINLDATKVVCSGIFDPQTRQVQWDVATGSSNIPVLGLTLQTDGMRSDEDGTHRGWATWDGNRTKALHKFLYADNIEANAARSRNLRPFNCLEGLGLVHLCDTGVTDNNVAFTATIVSKPYVLKTIMTQFGVMAAMLMAKAVTGAVVLINVIRDFGAEESTPRQVTMTATASEGTQVFRKMDDLFMSEARTVQFQFEDDPTNAGRWELNQLSLTQTEGGD